VRRRRLARHAPAVLVVAVLAAVPLIVTNNYYLDSIIVIFFWGSMAAAWNLVGGYAGQLSLGHTAFFGIGAYASSILFARYALTPWLGLLVGAALATVFAVFVGLVCFRLRGPFFALVTIAFAEVGLIVASSLRDLTKGTEGFNIPFRPAFENMLFRGKVGYFYLFLGYVVLLYVISRAVEQSKLGYSLIAFREDEEAARMLGVPTVRVRLIALGASAALTAVGGTLYAQYYQFLDPASTFGINFSIQVALLTMVGGIGTAVGPFFGALLMTPLGQFFRAWLGGGAAGLYLALYGIALILVVLFLPHGIVPEVRRRLGRRAHVEDDDDAP
jgi:branched-chain amino acid transport system permease protein